MAEHSFLKRNWKLILNLVTLAALAILIYAIRDQLAETIHNLERVNLWVLLLVVPLLGAIGYHAQAKLYQSIFRSLGSDVGYWSLIKVSLELNFVNHVFPSGGVSGFSYFGLRMRNFDVSVAKSTLAHTMKLIMMFLSFLIFIMVGMFLLAVNGQASNFVIFIGTSLAMTVLVGTAAFVYIIGSNERIDLFFTWLTKLLNRTIQLVLPSRPETIHVGRAREMFKEFHISYVELRGKIHELRGPFWWGFVINLTEILVVYAVYVAFGEWVNLGAIILAYAIANVAGLISVLPGGVGVYEGLMTAVLAAAGIPAAVSLPVTIMYRVINTVIQIPPGYYLYHRALRGDRSKA